MKHAFYSATALSLVMFAGFAAPASAATNQDTVITDDGRIVVTQTGKCVRSKWMADGDECAPAPEPEERKAVAQEPSVQPDKEQRTVYFDFNKSSLSLNAAQKVDSLIAWLAGAKGVTSAKIIGYADEIGNQAYNQKLSENRANSVKKYLADKGVTLPTNVEVVKGLGATNSVTQCDDVKKREEKIACLAADRRVEIEFNIVR